MAAYCISCLLRNPFPWLAALGYLLAFSHSQGLGFLTIFLTSSAVMLCPVILCRCEQTQGSTREPSSTADSHSDSISPADQCLRKGDHNAAAEGAAAKMEDEPASKLRNQQQKEEGEEEEEEEEERAGSEYMERSSAEAEVLLSDSESVDHTTSSEDYSENDSMFRENLSGSTNYSDGSISDEESLIEIVLPTGQYVDSKTSQQEPSWCNGYQQKWPDCSLQSHFRHQNWMELMQNELSDENFIEIDLCMGSIKCSRFEIQA